MQIRAIKYISAVFFLLLMCVISTQAKTVRYRAMWRTDPATTMVIGWDQISGAQPIMYYGKTDHGKNCAAYTSRQAPNHVNHAKDMKNHFVRLHNLEPNTVYYFVVQDSEGIGRRMSFKTAPDNIHERLSIIAGGDSRNNREARLNANKMVSKLRPDFILFSGDMTADDNGKQWQTWFDDWQMTIGSDGRLFPVIIARGNHEFTNKGLVDLFDIKSETIYYGLSFGGNLLRIYTLNTLLPSGGYQKQWLETDLQNNRNKIWKIAQYHQAIKPHTDSKPEKNELLVNWSTLFHKYHVDIALESDAHVVKWTWPIRPSREEGSEEGFIRDDEKGTVYLGEGGWGAPLRTNNDDKSWTRNSGSFNQFKWIFVDQYHIEVRTIRTKGVGKVAEVSDDNKFALPNGLSVWAPSNGDVLTVVNRNAPLPPPESEPQDANADYVENIQETDIDTEENTTPLDPVKWLNIDPFNNTVKIRYQLEHTAKVDIIIIDKNLKEVTRATLKNQSIGPYVKNLDFSKIAKGGYMIVIKANDKVLRRYRVKKA